MGCPCNLSSSLHGPPPLIGCVALHVISPASIGSIHLRLQLSSIQESGFISTKKVFAFAFFSALTKNITRLLFFFCNATQRNASGQVVRQPATTQMHVSPQLITPSPPCIPALPCVNTSSSRLTVLSCLARPPHWRTRKQSIYCLSLKLPVQACIWWFLNAVGDASPH